MSLQLRNQHAITLPQLLDVIAGSLAGGRIEALLLPHVFNVREWLEPVLNEIHNQSFPHVYR